MSPIEIIYYVTGILTALGAIIAGIVSVSKVIQKITRAVGADKDGKTVSERLERIEHQLWENGGSSLADRVNILALESKETVADLRFIKKILLANYHLEPETTEEEETIPIKVIRRPRKTSK